jgi:hypothetical protein
MAMSEDEINKRVSSETSRTSASVGLNVDLRSMQSFYDSIVKIRKEAEELRNALSSAFSTIKQMKSDYGLEFEGMASDTGGGFRDVVSSGGRRRKGSLYTASEPEPIKPARQPAAEAGKEVAGKPGIGAGILSGAGGQMPSGGTGIAGGITSLTGGGFKAPAGGANVAGVATAALSAGISAIDSRIATGRDYALSADKLSVLLQQITGGTQRDIMAMRAPLTNYRLGAGGINQLLGLQASTGINAQQQASSVEFMRTLSGFTMDAGGATSIIRSLADPETVNRMFMMTGTSLIGPGGQVRDTKSLIQDLAKRAGLTDPRLAKSAIAPGSVTRANLAQMGVVGDLQEQVIQYAQSNIQFQKRGGRGMYDPSSEEDRKKMGIEENFATQEAETERVRGKRSEQFYRDQADSYASLEKQTQTLTEVFGKLEHQLRGIISARTENRLGMKLLGGALMLGGAALAPFSAGGSLAAVGIGAAMVGNPVGDGLEPTKSDYSTSKPPTGDGSISRPIGGLGGQAPQTSWGGLKPVMRERIRKLADAAARDGIQLRASDGWRSSKNQETEFLKRYDVTTDPSPYSDPLDKSIKTPIKWGGVMWKKVTASYDMAPPGSSMHEIGLAVDLDLRNPKTKSWVKRNLHLYGLRDFEAVNGEPHHIQPSDIPAGRSEYENRGAVYGTNIAPGGAPDIPREMADAWIAQGLIPPPTTSTPGVVSQPASQPSSPVSIPSMAPVSQPSVSPSMPSSDNGYRTTLRSITGDGLSAPLDIRPTSRLLSQPSNVSRVTNEGHTFNMPVTINLSTNGSVSEVDTRELARKVANHLEKEVNLINIRSW